MTIPYSDAAMGNIFKLTGLKNVHGRRKVLPGDEIEQNSEMPENNMEGISEPYSGDYGNGQNLPEQDFGGELTAQSYDVRANKVQNPEDRANIFSRLGQTLPTAMGYPQQDEEIDPENNIFNTVKQGYNKFVDYAQNDPKNYKTYSSDDRDMNYPQLSEKYPGQPDAGTGLPNETYSGYYSPMTERQKPILSQYSDFVDENRSKIHPSFQKIKDAKQREAEQLKKVEQNQEEFNEAIRSGQINPGEFTVYGSAQTVADDPVLSAQFKEFTGEEITPEMTKQITDYQKSMQEVTDYLEGNSTSLEGLEDNISQRILENQATDNDKYYIGLALLMPLIVGGFLGKEAAFGALGGAASGFAKGLESREKGIREDENTLLDIAKQKTANAEKLANIGAEKSKFKENLEKAHREKSEHLLGKHVASFVNPDTGKKEKIVDIAPGLVAKYRYANRKDEVKAREVDAKELNKVKKSVQNINGITSKIMNITNQLEKPTDIYQFFVNHASKDKSLIPKLTQDVIVDGVKINAGVALENFIGLLTNEYTKATGMGQLDRAALDHMDRIVRNPTTSFTNPKDVVNQLLQIRNLTQDSYLNDVENRGFYSQFPAFEFEEENKNLYDFLNKKEKIKERDEYMKELYSEV